MNESSETDETDKTGKTDETDKTDKTVSGGTTETVTRVPPDESADEAGPDPIGTATRVP